jgi:translation initiation factor 3 subunit H
MASGGPISFANVAQKDQRKLPLRSVQLEGQVLLKIAQHCATASSTNVLSGQLLGLDVGQTLEVTDCFPVPVSLCCFQDISVCD